jgi:hypothetical protein
VTFSYRWKIEHRSVMTCVKGGGFLTAVIKLGYYQVRLTVGSTHCSHSMGIYSSNLECPGRNEYRRLPVFLILGTYHVAFSRKHIVLWIMLMLGAAANPLSPDSSQLLLVLSITSKTPLLYLRHVLFFCFLHLDMLMVKSLTGILCGTQPR